MHIYAVGVVSPHSDKLDIVNYYVCAGGEVHRPLVRVNYRNALNTNVFAGGDAVTGAATVILAMGAGKTAAEAIDEYIKTK